MASDPRPIERLAPDEKRREAIRRSLLADPDRTNTEIAREHGASRWAVARERERCSDGRRDSSRPYTKGTPEERRRARLLADEGMSQADIGRLLGRPQNTIHAWLKRTPSERDELEHLRHERSVREERAWSGVLDLNRRALTMWEGRAAILGAIERQPDAHALAALLQSVRRTQAMLGELAGALDARVGDDDRERIDAFLRASGFGS